MAIVAASVGAARIATAACGAPDFPTITRTIRRSDICLARRLGSNPPTSCTPTTGPACAGSLVRDALALAYAQFDPPATPPDSLTLARQIKCQRMIGGTASRFVMRYIRGLAVGMSQGAAAQRAVTGLTLLRHACGVTVAQDASGFVLPRVGAQCQAAVGDPGAIVDPQVLQDCLVSLLATWVNRAVLGTAPRPNIVFILTDDQRWDMVGPLHSVSGVDPVMPTVVRELQANGVTFSNGFVTTPLCCPSRATIFSGLYAHTTGVHTNSLPDGGASLFHDASTLPVWLKAAGYRTALYGKYMNGYKDISPYVPPGWDEFHVFRETSYYSYVLAENGVEKTFGFARKDYSTDVLRDKVVDFIHTHGNDGQPFFVEYAPYAPHAPATPAARHLGMFNNLSPWRPPNFAEADASDKPAWVQAIDWTGTAETLNDNFRQKQLESLQAVDEAVAAILQALKDVGHLDDTFILFASDNGYSWGAHRWRPKDCPYEECLRVPVIVRYRPLAPLRRTDPSIVLNLDLCETFAELAGATPGPGVEGASLVRVIDGTEPTWRTDFVEEHWHSLPEDVPIIQIPDFAGVHTPVWKYVEYVTGETELYNLVTDPFELQNGSHDPANAAIRQQLAARLRELDPGWSPKRALRAVRTQAMPGLDYYNDDEFDALQ